MKIGAETQWDDFYANAVSGRIPGVPTFEEFAKNPDKYLPKKSEDSKMGMLDNGPVQVRGMISKVKYYVKGHFCRTPEKAERVAASENIDLRYPEPQFVPDVNGKGEMHIHFNTPKRSQSALILPP